MDITVKMTAEEFVDFLAYQKDKSTFAQRLQNDRDRMGFWANKICWSLGADPKKAGKVKIIDQEHAGELPGAC